MFSKITDKSYDKEIKFLLENKLLETNQIDIV